MDEVTGAPLSQDNPWASLETLNKHIAYCLYNSMKPGMSAKDSAWWAQRACHWSEYIEEMKKKEGTTHG